MKTMTITISSPAFASGARMPVAHTDDGADHSPALEWSGVPEDAESLALICDDPDAPTSTPWVHWVLYGIPADAGGLPKGVPNTPRVDALHGASQGVNSWGTIGWRGPSPPPGHGVHHYHFHLYALDTMPHLEPGLDKAALLHAINAHVIADGELIGTYERKRR